MKIGIFVENDSKRTFVWRTTHKRGAKMRQFRECRVEDLGQKACQMSRFISNNKLARGYA